MGELPVLAVARFGRGPRGCMAPPELIGRVHLVLGILTGVLSIAIAAGAMKSGSPVVRNLGWTPLVLTVAAAAFVSPSAIERGTADGDPDARFAGPIAGGLGRRSGGGYVAKLDRRSGARGRHLETFSANVGHSCAGAREAPQKELKGGADFEELAREN